MAEFEVSHRKKKNKGSSQSFKMKGARGNPEGDSILHKRQFKFAVPPNSDMDVSSDSGVSTMKRRKQMRYQEEYVPGMKKNRHMAYSDSDISMLDQTDTPDSLSQISAIPPISEMSMAQTTFSRMKPSNKPADTTWENAVSRARGEPDGAEKSFHKKKSKASVHEVLATVPEDAPVTEGDQENTPEAANTEPTVQRKKSIKVQLKKAASMLKTKKSKSKLVEGKTGKKKLNTTLADETMTKKPVMKDLPKKERKQVRKMMKSNFDHIARSKKIWEELRRADIKLEKKHQLCSELMLMVKGKMKEFCFAHDTARILQCLLQYGSLTHRETVFEELKGEIVVMIKNKYSKFLVKKMFMYGSKPQRSVLFKSMHGNVRKLIRHREAADVIEYAYNEHANAPQRLSMLEDFYGPSFALFKTPDIKSLDQIMFSQPDKRDMILRNMKEALLPLIDKTILVHSMVHKVFQEFFMYADPKMKSDMIESLRESIQHMIHTRDGARVGMNCVWHGTAKDRKVIIKSLKTHIVKICKEEYGHMVLLAIFDTVDDTRLVKLAILEEMLKSLNEVASDQHGRKVLLYLLSPRDPLYFHPDIVRILHDGDRSLTSKKDKTLRYKELLEPVSQPLVTHVVDNITSMIQNNSSLVLVMAVILHATSDVTPGMEAIAKMAAAPFVQGQGEQMHIVESPAGHMTLKRLIQNDKDRMTAGEEVLFSKVLLKALPEGALKSWAAINRGCFTLMFLFDLAIAEVSQSVKKELTGVKSSLRKMTFKGAQLLLQKLENAT